MGLDEQSSDNDNLLLSCRYPGLLSVLSYSEFRSQSIVQFLLLLYQGRIPSRRQLPNGRRRQREIAQHERRS